MWDGPDVPTQPQPHGASCISTSAIFLLLHLGNCYLLPPLDFGDLYPIRKHFISSETGNLCPLRLCVCPCCSHLGYLSHPWLNVPQLWPLPFSFNILQNQLLNQEYVQLSAVIFGGKGAGLDSKCCLFILLLLQLQQECYSWHRISRGRAVLRFVGLI